MTCLAHKQFDARFVNCVSSGIRLNKYVMVEVQPELRCDLLTPLHVNLINQGNRLDWTSRDTELEPEHHDVDEVVEGVSSLAYHCEDINACLGDVFIVHAQNV